MWTQPVMRRALNRPPRREEIQAEGLTRSIGNFGRFLDVAGLTKGQVNCASVASDVGLPPGTVRQHYQILEDTPIGYQLPAYQDTHKRKPVATAKLFFFECWRSQRPAAHRDHRAPTRCLRPGTRAPDLSRVSRFSRLSPAR